MRSACATPVAVSHSAITSNRASTRRIRFADSDLATMIRAVVGLRQRREVGGEVGGAGGFTRTMTRLGIELATR